MECKLSVNMYYLFLKATRNITSFTGHGKWKNGNVVQIEKTFWLFSHHSFMKQKNSPEGGLVQV